MTRSPEHFALGEHSAGAAEQRMTSDADGQYLEEIKKRTAIVAGWPRRSTPEGQEFRNTYHDVRGRLSAWGVFNHDEGAGIAEEIARLGCHVADLQRLVETLASRSELEVRVRTLEGVDGPAPVRREELTELRAYIDGVLEGVNAKNQTDAMPADGYWGQFDAEPRREVGPPERVLTRAEEARISNIEDRVTALANAISPKRAGPT